MQEVTYLESDQDLKELIFKIQLFSEETEVPFWQQLNEVTSSFTNPNIITLIGRVDGKVQGYICGYFMNRRDFMVTQIYSTTESLTKILYLKLESDLKGKGVVKIFGMSKPHPRVFEKYGFKHERYVISKDITGGEK